MKWLLYVVIGLIVIVLALGLAKDVIIKTAVEKGVEVVTGLQLHIASFHMGIIKQVVAIKDLKLFNPKDFEDKVMLNMPEIYVDYDLPAIISGKLHIPEIRVDLKEFVVEKNAKGALNLDSLNVVQAQKGGGKAQAQAQAQAQMPPMMIDMLSLKIGKVVYKDYSGGGAPSVNEFNINIDETFRNIDNPSSVVAIIIVKALMNTTIGQLANFDIGGLQGSVSGTLSTATKTATQAAATATKTATVATKAATQAATTATKQASQAVGGAAESVEKAASSVFGVFGGDKK